MNTPNSAKQVRVWDPIVRMGHWFLLLGFVIAFITHEGADRGTSGLLHIWAGYGVGVVLIIRIAWGFFGTRYARFSSFLFSPKRTFIYLRDLLLRRSPRYVGHSPAGAAMIFALILSLGGTVGTGLYLLAEEGKGPLSSFVQQVERPLPEVQPRERSREGYERAKSSVLEAHELLTNLSVFLIFVHVAGVLWAGFVHRENLLAAMFTGRKRTGGSETIDIS